MSILYKVFHLYDADAIVSLGTTTTTPQAEPQRETPTPFRPTANTPRPDLSQHSVRKTISIIQYAIAIFVNNFYIKQFYTRTYNAQPPLSTSAESSGHETRPSHDTSNVNRNYNLYKIFIIYY